MQERRLSHTHNSHARAHACAREQREGPKERNGEIGQGRGEASETLLSSHTIASSKNNRNWNEIAVRSKVSGHHGESKRENESPFSPGHRLDVPSALR